MKTGELAKNIREIYIQLNKNYTLFTSLKNFKKLDASLYELFSPNIANKLSEDLGNLALLKDNSDNTSAYLNFSGEFNFAQSDQQKKYGQQILIFEVIKHIKQLQQRDRPNCIVSLGIGNGRTASQYAKELKLKDIMIGVDIHKNYLHEACKLIPSLKHTEFDFNTLQCGKCLDIETKSVDIVECTMVAHHVEKFDTLIIEINRLLREDGMFYYLDIIDKTCLEENMVYQSNHIYPSYHGIEFFRSHEEIKAVVSKFFSIIKYERIGPGILFLSAKKFHN